mgnify:CR=1 FL=1
MESERFFDLVRWGDADTVLNKYFAGESDNCSIYGAAHFTKNKNEYFANTLLTGGSIKRTLHPEHRRMVI